MLNRERKIAIAACIIGFSLSVFVSCVLGRTSWITVARSGVASVLAFPCILGVFWFVNRSKARKGRAARTFSSSVESSVGADTNGTSSAQ